MVSPAETDGMHARENRHRTPDQILGPYFPMRHTPVPQADLTSVNGVDGFAQGEIIEVTGRILNLAGEPVRSVPVTIWQANTFGRYDHGNDPNPAPLDPNFVGCVGVQSDDDGIYRIKTGKAGRLSGRTRLDAAAAYSLRGPRPVRTADHADVFS